jgi:hypothetical protein
MHAQALDATHGRVASACRGQGYGLLERGLLLLLRGSLTWPRPLGRWWPASPEPAYLEPSSSISAVEEGEEGLNRK